MGARTMIRAAQLGGDHIGSVIRADVLTGTVVEDEVRRIEQHDGVTLVTFANVMPVPDHNRLEHVAHFRLDHGDLVEVI